MASIRVDISVALETTGLLYMRKNPNLKSIFFGTFR